MDGSAPTQKRVRLVYAEASRDLAAQLGRALEAAGFVLIGAPASDGAEDAVIVCWTPAGVASDHVNMEAARARKAKTFAPILLAPCSPPGSLGQPLADLSGWHGDAASPEFRKLVQTLHARLSKRMFSGDLWRSRYLSWGGLGAAALGGVAIIANLGDLGQTIDGAFNPAASERTLSATNAKVEEVLLLLKQKSPQPLSADAEAALRDSIERLLSAQSGARGRAAGRLADGDFEGALKDLNAAAQEGDVVARGLSETWQEIGALLYTTDTFGSREAYQRAVELDPANPVARAQLGSLYIRTGLLDDAKRNFEDMLHYSDGDDVIGVAYGHLGVIAMLRGDLADARLYFESGMEFSEKAGNLVAKAADLADLGEIARLERNFQEAERLLKASADLHRQHGSDEGVALATARLGAVARDRKRSGEAETLLRDALAIAEGAGHAEGIALAQSGLGDVALDRGQLDQAKAFYQASYTAAFEIAAIEAEAIALIGLGNVAERQGDSLKAIDHFREAWGNFRDMGLPNRQADMMARVEALGATPSPEGPEN